MRRASIERFLWRLETPGGLAALFVAGLLVRLLIAPHVGFFIDLRFFRTWAVGLRELGTHHFYANEPTADYPPGYLYVLWLTGKLSASPGYLLLKLPPILADLGLAWVAGTFAARLAPASVGQRLPIRALVAAAVLFNPAVILLSAGWGQVDAVPTLLVLSSLLLLFTGAHSLRRDVGGFLLFGASVAMKPQSGFVLPVMLYALYRRYLHGRRGSELFDGAIAVALVGMPALALWAVSGLPFGLGPASLFRFFRHSAALHPVTSSNAFNLWGVIAFWRPDSSAGAVKVAGVPAVDVGVILVAAGVGLVLWWVHRALQRGADEGRVFTAAAAVVSLLAYVFLTRMHERYLFLSLACFAPLLFVRRVRLAYAALSVLFVLNLWYAYAAFNTQSGVEALRFNPWYDWIFGGFQTDPWQKKLISLAVTLLALGVSWVALHWAADERGEAAPPAPAVLPTPHAEDVRGRRAARWAPLALVGLTCVFCLFVLRSEVKPAEPLNDSSLHLQMVRWADAQIGEGRVPLDGWYPYSAFGSSHFHHYQSLSEALTAYAARASGASDQRTYLWLQYLLLALWPAAVYVGSRLLGWGRWVAAASAAVSPLLVSAPGYGYEHGSYTWQGYGVYSQLWAMWLLPIAWGLTWRAVTGGRRYAAAAAALALTMATHFITGYLGVLTIGVWVLVAAGSSLLQRAFRAAIVVVGSVLVAAWVLVPLVGDIKWTAESEYYQGTFFNDSYGAPKVLRWLFTGRLFDNQRWPVITVLFFVGLGVCAWNARRDVRARALLGAFTLSLLLFFGRPTLGRVLDLLPGFHNVQIHRFIVGVHLAGILIAGVGLAWLLRTAAALVARVRPALVANRLALAAATLAAVVVVLAPAWLERARYDLRDGRNIPAQEVSDRTDGRDVLVLIDIVNSRGDGRAYAGLPANWGHQYQVGAAPVHAYLANYDVDAIGFVFRTIASLSTDVEVAFDETNPAQYQMFNVRYLILPSDRQPSVHARLIASRGRHRLWEVQTSGYFQVVDRAAAISEDRADIQTQSRQFRDSDLASRSIYPGVAFAGGAAPAPTFAGSSPPPGPPGQVLAQHTRLADGVATATVVANRPAVVLLKSTFDPRWTVTVDGIPDHPTMMAPSLVGVEVPTGRHVVAFRYRPYGSYPLLLSVGFLSLLALVLVPRRGLVLERLGRFSAHRVGWSGCRLVWRRSDLE